ncbi:MAG: hypothetical protein JO328_04885 [Hyphomicrobiales bacterium]|nr:hypothetical protein [Hyphomicrobiales bacterium]MBV8825561.1 hypothetical protein [Hyphomicrobiales bacterium]MBV9430118.1 hypothetical protein [Bradyrhizobiaceae bacterium]
MDTTVKPSPYAYNASEARRRLWAGWLDLAGALAILALLWSPILRNDGTPAGDGARLMKFISFAHDVGGFAFWNPYRNGGYPLAADPEQFWLLSLVVDPNSPYANLMLNAAIFALVLLAAVPAWLIGRKLGLRPFWNVLFVVMLGLNERVIWLQASGRIAALVSHAALLVVVWNLLYARLRPWNYALISFAIGVAFAMSAQFALVHCALVLSVFLFRDGAPWRRPLRHSLSALGRAALVSVTGFALSGVYSIPVLAHFAESHRITSALAYPPEAPDTVLTYLRLFVPFVPADIEHAAFLSLVPLAALFLARWARPAKVTPGGLGFDLIYLWGAFFFVMSVPLIGPVAKALYQMFTLVSGMRWFAPLEDVLRTAWVISAFTIFQALERRRVDELGGTIRLLLGGYLGLIAVFAVVHGITEHEPVTIAAAVAAALLAAYALISSLGIRFAPLERVTVAGLGVALAVLSVGLIASDVVWQYYPERPNHPFRHVAAHESNQRDLPGLEGIVRADADPYFRFFTDDYSLLWYLDDEKRGTAGFSLFYPPSLARTLTYLSPRHEVHQLRPHWVELVPCGELDPRALDLIGVKYMFCFVRRRPEPHLSPNWQEAGREGGYVLFRNAAYEEGIRIFCSWRAGHPPWQRNDVLSAFSEDMALLDAAAVRGLVEPAAECAGSRGTGRDVAVVEDRPGHLTLKLTSATPGIVFIPDNYDRGWRGTVNGIATPVLEVYGAYLGLPIGPGESVVRLDYRDNYFWAGLETSAVAAIGLCAFAAFAGRRLAGRLKAKA